MATEHPVQDLNQPIIEKNIYDEQQILVDPSLAAVVQNYHDFNNANSEGLESAVEVGEKNDRLDEDEMRNAFNSSSTSVISSVPKKLFGAEFISTPQLPSQSMEPRDEIENESPTPVTSIHEDFEDSILPKEILILKKPKSRRGKKNPNDNSDDGCCNECCYNCLLCFAIFCDCLGC